MTTTKIMKIDNRIISFESKLQENVKNMETKHNSLNEQLKNFSNFFDEERIKKEIQATHNKRLEEMKNLEIKLKKMLLEERQVR